ncbi:MAG: hypothetical protein EZS28_030263 [Streblomastix strix]|uniref:DNA-directed DNA polymerase n=1 Tax=Streblomastix strix TaxID=222440 RepID=A0A5J4UVP6_9EUKA|nr:MAG: hypothetical protein EZS28_030263 [Streblomastix strix]
MEAVAKALHPDCKEKRYFNNEIINISKQLLVQVLELPFDSKSRRMTDLLKTFEGLDITKHANIVSQKLKINQDIYYYDNEHKNYYRGQQIMYQSEDQNEGIKTIDILVVESEWEANKISHAFAIANKQALTGLKFCPHCSSKAFDPKDKNYSRDYEKHIIKCENNERKIVKKVKLDYIQKPYCPHIMQNKTYQYLLANGRQHEFKTTQYFITYDLETVPKVVNKKFGKSSYQMYELFPLSVASTIRNKQGIKKIFFSQQDGDDFIVQWLNQLFKEAELVNADNQYITEACTIDETIPYSMEVPIVGFNSSRFDISLIISQMQCKDWTISNYIGSPTQAKQVIVHHKKMNLKVKFVDMLTYLQPMELKQAAKDFGDGYDDKKGLFLYEAFNTDNVNEVLSKSEPFTMEDFNSSLKKTKISQKDYQIYLEDAKRFKNRWDYLQFYNEQDTYIMIKPLMTLISLQFKYKIDMFSFMSMAACSNAIKYAKAYEDFDINGAYPNFEDQSQKFYLTENYWQSKVRGYQLQDKHQRRDTTNNVQDKDFGYFKQLFKDFNCCICGCKFTVNNKPTLDRIDNSKGHSKDNVQPCCLYCNCFCSNKDKNIGKLFIQLRKYCMIRCLPTNLTDIDVYHLIRSGITGGLSNVMHRVNRAGIDFIKRLYYNKEAKKVTIVTTDHRITHVVGVDFNSLYPSVMSSEPHKFIKYTNGKMYMCGSQTGKIMGDNDHSKQTILRIINSNKRFTADGQLFVAEVKGHIQEDYLNDFINFPPILRNYEFTTDERTIGSYMYNHMKNNNVKTDQKQRKLTNLTSTMGEYMAFSSYYLWFLIDDCHFIIDDVRQIVLFNKHDQFNSFIKEFTKNRIEAKLDENKGQEQFFKIVMNSSYGSDGMNTEKYHKVKIMNRKQTERAIKSNAFMDEQKISEDSYIVQMNPEHCS